MLSRALLPSILLASTLESSLGFACRQPLRLGAMSSRVNAPSRLCLASVGATTLRAAQGDDYALEIPYGLVENADDFSSNAAKRGDTLTRVILPTVAAAALATVFYPSLSNLIKGALDTGELSIIGNDSSQFIQNFVTVNGLILSILCGNTFVFLYQQTESIYKALYAEVSEAKSLLEQTALVCSGRPFYRDVLLAIQRYVANDLKRLDYSPATLLSQRPANDPLESILYLTSVRRSRAQPARPAPRAAANPPLTRR